MGVTLSKLKPLVLEQCQPCDVPLRTAILSKRKSRITDSGSPRNSKLGLLITRMKGPVQL